MKDVDFQVHENRSPLTGMVLLPREITSMRIWTRKPFDPGRALVDLHLLANTEAGTLQFGSGVKVDYQPGQLVRSIQGLAERWGWGRDTVRDFLRTLEEAEVLKIVAEHQHGKLIQILAYKSAAQVTSHVTGEVTAQVTRQATEGVWSKEIGDKERECTAKSPAEVGGNNFPPLAIAAKYFVDNGSDYTAEEVSAAWHALNATAQDGVWFFGRRPVGDWRSALETRLADQRVFQGKNSGAAAANGYEHDRGAVPEPAVPTVLSFAALRCETQVPAGGGA